MKFRENCAAAVVSHYLLLMAFLPTSRIMSPFQLVVTGYVAENGISVEKSLGGCFMHVITS